MCRAQTFRLLLAACCVGACLGLRGPLPGRGQPHLRTPSSRAAAGRLFALRPLSPPSLERLVPQSVSKEQWLHFWGTSELTRGNRIFEVIIVSFFGLWSTWFLSFAIGNTVGTFLAFIFIFWWLIAPYLAAARRNADFREGITRAANPFKSARREFTALFTGEVAACERVAADVNGRRYMLRLSIRDESGRLLQVRAPLQDRHVEVASGQRCFALVVSSDRSFERIDRVSDVFIPSIPAWAGEYPYVRWDRFPRIRPARTRARTAERRYDDGDAGADWGDRPAPSRGERRSPRQRA